MKEITHFDGPIAANVSNLGSLDPTGSSIDKVFAEAIMANKPTSILEEAGIITVKVAEPEKDIVSFPIIRNTQLTWSKIGRGTNDTGSDLGASKLNAVEYKEVTPTGKTANIFIPDNVSLLNKVDFATYSLIGATDAQRQKEEEGIGSLMTEASVGTVKVAGGYTASTGSISAGSTLDPLDLVYAKRDLSTGSDINKPDFVLMHPNQYAQLNTHADFAPGATTNGAMMRKAKFDENGDIVRFDGMDIYVSELVPAQSGGYYAVAGHPVIVGKKGICLGRGEHHGIKVSTEDSRRRHGQWKIFDMSYDYTVLVKESLVLLRAAD